MIENLDNYPEKKYLVENAYLEKDTILSIAQFGRDYPDFNHEISIQRYDAGWASACIYLIIHGERRNVYLGYLGKTPYEALSKLAEAIKRILAKDVDTRVQIF
jgi:hypothetical protein